MPALTWDQVGEHLYETGVDHGVLYIPDDEGDYTQGFPWNGLTTVTESPTGAESNPQYADNIVYLNLVSAELFGATIEAFTYPEEFAQCDGTAVPSPGLTIGQQGRRAFGMAYRSRVGNDVEGSDFGYKLHLIYGAQAAPSEKAYATINDSPEAIAFSWEVTTTPVGVTGAGNYKPTSLITVNSVTADPDALAELEGILYGDEGVDARLPLPDEVIALFGGGAGTSVRLTGANAPSYDAATHVVTIPTVAGVTFKVNGVEATPGPQPALTVGQTSNVTADAAPGTNIEGDDDWTYDY